MTPFELLAKLSELMALPAEEELDFIINYDIKYRMGQEGSEDGEE